MIIKDSDTTLGFDPNMSYYSIIPKVTSKRTMSAYLR